jgi:hypothetical protein
MQPGENAGLVRGERGGRLIEDEHARLAEQGLGDLHHLPAAKRRLATGMSSGSVEADHARRPPARRVKRGVVDEAQAPRVGAEADILGDRQVGGEARAPAARRRCRCAGPRAG